MSHKHRKKGSVPATRGGHFDAAAMGDNEAIDNNINIHEHSNNNNEDNIVSSTTQHQPPPPPTPLVAEMPTTVGKRIPPGSEDDRVYISREEAMGSDVEEEDVSRPPAADADVEKATVVSMKARRAAAKGPSPPADDDAILSRMIRLQSVFEKQREHLYSYCGLHTMEWPSLAVEWIPDRRFQDPERDYTLNYIAVGTQTTIKNQNEVRIMELALPVPPSDTMYYLYGDNDLDDGSSSDSAEREAGKQFKKVKGHFRCDQVVRVDAPVLKIRAMPLATNTIAVKTGSGAVVVYCLDHTLEDTSVTEDLPPSAVLRGHKLGGFGLSWNAVKPGLIVSGGDDGYVMYWDIKGQISGDGADDSSPDAMGTDAHPITRFVGHRDIVTDVCWHATHGHLVASSSLDSDVRIWDIRTDSTSTVLTNAHSGGATAAQFHPVGVFQLATSGLDGVVSLWDIRRPDASVMELGYHGSHVTGVQWSPFSDTVLASFGEDQRVVVWDVAKTSLPLSYSESGGAPPEVSFVHIGHMSAVTDFAWNPCRADRWWMASADQLNGLHVYCPKMSVVMDYVPPPVLY